MYLQHTEISQQFQEASQQKFGYLYYFKLACYPKQLHLNLIFPKMNPTTLVEFLPSSFTYLQSLSSLTHCQPHLELEQHTASAFSSWQWLFYTIGSPLYTHWLINRCHFLSSSYHKQSMYSPSILLQRCHHVVQELEEWQMKVMWRRTMLVVTEWWICVFTWWLRAHR
jgi:hypothetical protein